MADKHIISSGVRKHMNFALEGNTRSSLDFSQLFCWPLIEIQQYRHLPCKLYTLEGTIGLLPPHGSPKVFDSLYNSIDQPTSTLLSSLYGSSPKIEKGPKQVSVKDCGVYAIVTATLLASGGNPESVTIGQLAMRGHLLKCFENFQLTPFL